MFTQLVMKPFLDWVLAVGNDLLYPAMFAIWFWAVASRVLIWWTVRRHEFFAYEFEKRVSRFLDHDDHGERHSFYMLTKRLLERTFYEIFEVRDRLKRRRPDNVMSLSDRLFLIRPGSAWIVRDTLKQVRHLRKGENPDLLSVTKTVFYKNPYFNRVFGVVPAAGYNDVLNILPGMFVIAGIFGTFIGIMQALPTLGGMNLQDVEGTKKIMDDFLVNIAFSMGTSIVGILLSVSLNFLNTMMSPEKVFVNVIDRFENSLLLLWNRSETNEIKKDAREFDENRDAVEALAEAALNQELAKRKDDRDHDGYTSDRKQAS